MSIRYKFTLATILLLFMPVSAHAAGVIDTISIDDSENPATIRIDFTIPLQYINHAPENQGDELQVQFRTISSNLFSVQTEATEQQTVVPPTSHLVPLTDASYRGVGGAEAGVLTLRFSRKVNYTVYPGVDRRHVLIKVVTVDNAVEKQPQPTVSQPTSTYKSNKRRFNLTQHYTINLDIYLEGKDQPPLKDMPEQDQYVIYTTDFPIQGRVWSLLRVGFFDTRQQAEVYMKKIINLYPGAWVAYADAKEIDKAQQQETLLKKVVKAPVVRPQSVLPATDDKKIYDLMERARKAIAKNDVNHAVQLYTKVRSYPENPYSRDALEFLGLARERKRQYAHAIRVYNEYIELYPEGEGVTRVKQRLAGITTARQQAKKPADGGKTGAVASAKTESERANPWEVFGGFSQFYRRDEFKTEIGGSTTTQSSLANDLDITARKRTDKYAIQTRFTGSYLYDFLDDGRGDTSSISSLYVDGNEKQYGLSARLGRQSRNTGGVLGRFDGMLLSYQLNDRLTVNGVAGFPVFSTRDAVKTDRYLYGVSADIGAVANAWDFEAFYIEQQNNGILDRRAIGGEVRYFDPIRSMNGFIDYDISFDSLNTVILLGTWTLPDRTIINASLDYRNSPILTTTNALQGQNLRGLDDLLDSLTEDQIRQLAEDRTADATTVILGASHPLNDKLQITGDVTVTSLSGTNASGNVAATEESGNDYFYNMQLIASNLIKSGDISLLGLRYSDTSTSKISTLTLDMRYPIRTVWRINPRLRTDYRDNTNNNSTQLIVSPSLRIDYRWRRRYRFEFEAGGEWSNQDLPNGSQDTSSYFLDVGYRIDF
ncbi:hypothetical protein MNBD_GAMMA13-1820 [hydrothermal vent metagenome]|uniref:Uncharacterized protein n=1 Tax=hydrothermal vent metagenome TaxID=652676 RepID=A0A3B0ZA81_9ZZZZ